MKINGRVINWYIGAPSPDVLKEDELSSMTTYSVPKISFSSISFEMNTEKKLDLL